MGSGGCYPVLPVDWAPDWVPTPSEVNAVDQSFVPATHADRMYDFVLLLLSMCSSTFALKRSN